MGCDWGARSKWHVATVQPYCDKNNFWLDSRLLKRYHARRFARIRPMIRLALDNMKYAGIWENALEKLRQEKIPLSLIRSYALIGFDSGPEEAWMRCQWVDTHGIKVLPMWFHSLRQTTFNTVSKEQEHLGWCEKERKRIMGWFYKHRGSIPKFVGSEK